MRQKLLYVIGLLCYANFTSASAVNASGIPNAIVILLVLTTIIGLARFFDAQKDSDLYRTDVTNHHMSSIEFEKHVERYLQGQGYRTRVTKASGDFGVDIVASKEGKSYAVQVKRYATPVSRRAVSDAVAGKIFYNCDYAMVITNSTFTKSVKEMARSTECILVENIR